MVELAVEESGRPPAATYHYGLEAFDHWMAELGAGRVDGFGQSLTADITAERRTMAGQYLREVAPHFSQEIAAELLQAGEHYDAEAEQLTALAAMTPMMGGDSVDLEDPENRKRMVALVQKARGLEEKAVECLKEALRLMTP